MDNRDLYIERLTPSARMALKETAEEFSAKVLNRAFEIAQIRKTADMEISLRDIIEAKEQILDSKWKLEKTESRKRRLSLMISLIGAIYALAGMILFMFQSKPFDLKSDLGLIVSGIGITTMLLGFILTQLMYKSTIYMKRILDREFPIETKTDFDVVERWQIIEKLASDIMKERGYPENKAKSFNSILEFLSAHLPSNYNTDKLRQLLTTRNKILHEFYQPSKSEKSELITFSNSVIKTLENIRE